MGCTVTNLVILDQRAVVLIDDDSAVTKVDNIGTCYAYGTLVNAYNRETGTFYRYGADAVTTMQCTGGVLYDYSTGTVTNAYADGGLIDASRSVLTRTYTNYRVTNGGSILPGTGTTTSTNTGPPVALVNAP